MCGIAGIYAFHGSSPPVDRAELRTVRDYMAARGPDGHGEWFSSDGRVGLGHRRLAIIDLTDAGAQPMSSADGQLVITYNGEIYNHRELRRELEAAGRVFKSGSDTEVLLQLYAEHGEGMLTRLRGMFAFALWDARKRALLLARDAFGIKPLYYSHAKSGFRFASQVKALLAGGQVDTTPEPAGHAGFFLWGSVPAPWTLYRGIQALPAGHLMRVNAGGASQPQPFCLIKDILAEASAQPARGSIQDALDAIGSAVRDSIAAHHVADVPVGLFLSAGLDSAVITALSASRDAPPQTLTLAFSEYAGTPNDEAPLAQQVAHLYGTRHAMVRVGRSDFEGQSQALFDAMDQPSLDGVNAWYVAKAAHSQGLKVALSGLGGDELFASYPSFSQVPRLRKLVGPLAGMPGLGRAVRRVSSPVLSRFTSPKYASVLEYGSSLAGAYLLRRGLYMPWELPAVMDPGMAAQGWADLRCNALLKETTAGIGVDRVALSALEMSWYMRHQLLADTDWASMAHSLEVRVPFLDLPLLRTALPWLAAFPNLQKRQIAQHLAPQLPASVLDKPKTGFSVPVRDWLAPRQPAGAAQGRGLRGWANVVHGQFAKQPVRTELWSPAMAAPGGIQNYMWRLWEMLAARQGATNGPAGISLMDSPEALAAWRSPVAARPVGAAGSKLRFARHALSGAARGQAVIVGHLHHAPIAWVAKRLGRIDRYLVILHGIEAWRTLAFYQRAALASAHAVVATTHYTAQTCARLNGLSGRNFRVIPLCAEPCPAEADPDFLLEGDGFPVLFVGRLAASEKYKGLDTLIEATTLMHENNVAVTLHVIGDGDDRPRLEKLAMDAGLGRAVVFHGQVSDAQLQAAYARAQAFAMPSAGEGFGIVFLEAMRHRVACIGGAHGGTPEVIEDGKEGFLVTHGDANALAQRLELLASDAPRRERMAQAGWQRFQQDFTFPVFAARWNALLDESPAVERA